MLCSGPRPATIRGLFSIYRYPLWKKGEIKHLNLAESDLRYSELLKALADYQVGGLVICESPNLENDALTLQETYNNLMKANGE